MAGTHKTIAMKMGVKANMRAFFQTPDSAAIQNIQLPLLGIVQELEGEFDYIHLFAKKQADFHQYFPLLKSHLKQSGMLWVSWPKNYQLETDLNLKIVIKLGYDYGLVESKALSIDNTWSGLKFTHPKKGKRYNNLYGKLE